jgi:hypothetical protein
MSAVRDLWVPIIAVLVIIISVGCQTGSGSMAAAIGFGYGSDNISVNITQPQNESIVRSSPVTVSGSVPAKVEVLVNGNAVNMENGHFTASVQLEAGANLIEVLARDLEGRETAKYVNIVYVP